MESELAAIQHRERKSHSWTKFVPYQLRLLRFIINTTLFHSHIYENFLKHRSFGDTIPKFVRRDSGQLDGLSTNADSSTHRPHLSDIIDQVSQSRNLFRYFRVSSLIVELLFTVKEALTFSLRYLPDDSPYRLMDCFLLGRTTLTGTYTQVSLKFGAVFSATHLLWMLYNLVDDTPMRLGCLEFLLHRPEQVEAIELECAQIRDLPAESLDQTDAIVTSSIHRRRSITYHARDSLASLGLIDVDVQYSTRHKEPPFKPVKYPLFQYRGPHLKTSAHRDDAPCSTIRFRENRDLDSWSKLARTTFSFFGFVLVFILISIPPFMYFIGSVLLTRQGFELNYSTCANYIKSIGDQNQRQQFAYLYTPAADEPARPLSEVLEFTNLLPLTSPYNWIRLMCDIIQTSVIMNGLLVAFLSTTYILILIATDVDNYLDSLRDELIMLVDQMRADRSTYRQAVQLYGDLNSNLDDPVHKLEPGAIRRSSLQQTTKMNKSQMARHIYNLQARLMDFWAMVAHYNTYVGRVLLCLTGAWIVVLVIATDYLLSPGGVRYSILVASQVFTTVYFLYTAGHFALITRRIRRLYPLLMSAMALDDDCIDSKIRWPTILMYFHPKPLYTFTIAGFTISWAFCLQVSSPK